MKEVNGVKIEWFEGNAYVRLNQYEKLLNELKELEKKVAEKDRSSNKR